MRKTLLTLAFLLVSTAAMAQTHIVFSIHPRSTPNGAAVVTSAQISIATQVQCGQPKVTPPPANINPKVWRWDDPSNPTNDCVWDSRIPAPGQPIFAWPTIGEFVGKAIFLNVVGTNVLSGPESAPTDPFALIPLPGTAVNVRVSGQ